MGIFNLLILVYHKSSTLVLIGVILLYQRFGAILMSIYLLIQKNCLKNQALALVMLEGKLRNLIKNIKEQDQFFFSGTLYAPMFEKEIDVWIEKEAKLEYAERCAEQFVGLNDETVDSVCCRICDYHSYMLEEWNEEFVREINEKVPANVSGRDILNYIENPTLYVMKPLGEGLGYSVAGYCEWEP